MVTWGDTGLPVLACRVVYDSFSLSEALEELLLVKACEPAAATKGRP